eukprot:m.172374 g.172374  ORF g.172374 m.172374 type:complete len:5617 (+) comp39084_c0_seq35:292-17142(+)
MAGMQSDSSVAARAAKWISEKFVGTSYKSKLAENVRKILKKKPGKDLVSQIDEELGEFDAKNKKKGKNSDFGEDVGQLVDAISSHFHSNDALRGSAFSVLVVFSRVWLYKPFLRSHPNVTERIRSEIQHTAAVLSGRDLELMQRPKWQIDRISQCLSEVCKELAEATSTSEQIEVFFCTFSVLCSVKYAQSGQPTDLEGRINSKVWKKSPNILLDSLENFISNNGSRATLRSNTFLHILKDVFSPNWALEVPKYFPKFSALCQFDADQVLKELKTLVEGSKTSPNLLGYYAFVASYAQYIHEDCEQLLDQIFRDFFKKFLLMHYSRNLKENLQNAKAILGKFVPCLAEERDVKNVFERVLQSVLDRMAKSEVTVSDLVTIANDRGLFFPEKFAFGVFVNCLARNIRLVSKTETSKAAVELAKTVKCFQLQPFFNNFVEGGYLASLFEFVAEFIGKQSSSVCIVFKFLLQSELDSFPANKVPLPFEFPDFKQSSQYVKEMEAILKEMSDSRKVCPPCLIYELWKKFCLYVSDKISQFDLELDNFVALFSNVSPKMVHAKTTFFVACLKPHVAKLQARVIFSHKTHVLVERITEGEGEFDLREYGEDFIAGYTKVLEFTNKHAEAIKSGSFTEKQCREFSENSSCFNKILKALKKPEVTGSDIPDFHFAKSQLEATRPLLHWLKELTSNNDLVMAANEIDCALGVGRETTTYQELVRLSEGTLNHLKPLEEATLPDCEVGSTVKDFLVHFINRKSKLFTGHLDMIVRSSSQAQLSQTKWERTVEDVVCQMNRTFLNLIRLKAKVGTIKSLISRLEEQRIEFTITEEIQVLQSFPPYGAVSAPDVLAVIETVFETLRLLTWLPSLVEALLYLNSIDKSDSDFLYVQDASQKLKDVDKMTLEDIKDQFDELKVLFKGIDRNSFRLVRVAKECTNLVRFFRDTENDFYSERGMKRFRELRDLITTRLQGDKFHSSLMNAVIASHSSLMPWLRGEQSLAAVLQEVRTLPPTTEDTVKFLQTANDNISQITILFQNATAATMDNFQHLVEQINKSGKVVVNLGQLRGEKSSYKLVIEQRKQRFGGIRKKNIDNVEITESEVEELTRRLVFASKKSTSGQGSRFKETMSAATSLVRKVLELESAGYPGCQDREEKFEFDSSTLYDEEKTFKNNLEEWYDLVSNLRNEFHFFALFSKFDIMTMIMLLCKSEPRTRLIKKLMIVSSSEDADSENLLAASCLSRYMETASLSFQEVFVWDEEKISTEMKELEAYADDFSEVSKRLKELAMDLVKIPQPIESKGSQTAYCLSSSSLADSHLFILLSDIYSKSEMLPTVLQILWCSRSTTIDSLEDFFQKVVLFPQLDFVCVGVDLLPFKARQAVFRKQEDIASSCSHGNVHYVFTDTLNTSSVSQSQILTVNEFEATPEHIAELKERLGPMIADSNRPTVDCFYGASGIGKSHFIRRDCVGNSGNETDFITVAVNEHVDIPALIRRLNCLQKNATIVFNVSAYCTQKEVNRLFFDLVLCGGLYSNTHNSLFSFKHESSWKFLVELPCFEEVYEAEKTQQIFEAKLPMIHLVSSKVIEVNEDNNPWTIDGLELEVAKWVKANDNGTIDSRKSDSELLQVEDVKDEDEAREHVIEIAIKRMLSNVDPLKKKIVRFSLQLLAKRFEVFNTLVFKYEQLEHLGSTLFNQFIDEVNYLCQSSLICSWPSCSQSFLLTEQGEVSYYIFYRGDYKRLRPQIRNLTKDGEDRLEAVSKYRRLEECIGWVLHLSPDRVAALVQKKRFVLTQEFAYKLILLHQRKEARASVVIEGETGVGKTFLLEMYAMMLNEGMMSQKDDENNPRLLSRLCNWTKNSVVPQLEDNMLALMEETKEELTKRLANEDYNEEEIIVLWSKLSKVKISEETIDSMIEQMNVWYRELHILMEPQGRLKRWLDKDASCNPADFVRLFLKSELFPLFHKLLIHPGITETDVISFLRPVIGKAQKLKSIEFIIFFDEVNTAECMGLFKELLIDSTMNGESLPNNLFFIAAINPKIETADDEREEVDLGNPLELGKRVYFVHKLPEAMETLKWVFPGMDSPTLKDYIIRKIEIQQNSFGQDLEGRPIKLDRKLQEIFAKLLLSAQEYFKGTNESSVSQRDVKRVFELFPFMYNFALTQEERETHDPQQLMKKCLFLAIGLVYYLRLPEKNPTGGQSRDHFERYKGISVYRSFKKDVAEAIENFVTREHFVFPPGIALNKALKENIFAIVACIQAGVPLAIIGAPGSSKTLSFNIVRDNLHGESHSPREFCKQFCAVDPFFYQCSEYSTPGEIERTFAKAIDRQKFYDDREEKTRCVVLLDEAGLTQKNEKKMILKVLHPLLDDPKVSFVAISNHEFDAANANRMATVFRSLASEDDLLVLAEGCLGADFQQDSESELKNFVLGLCDSYTDLMRDDYFKNFFHYRDFIYTLRYLHRHSCLHKEGEKIKNLNIHSLLLLRALEENMRGAGSDRFKEIVQTFFTNVERRLRRSYDLPSEHDYRDVLTILQSALDHETDSAFARVPTGHPLSPRFIMIIDPSEDDSAVKLLFQTGLLSVERSKVFRLSEFAKDQTSLHDIQVLSEIRNALEDGLHTVLINTDRIHGSLYDLLNQNCRIVAAGKDDGEAEIYANIPVGEHTFPSRVHPKFRCLVVLKEKLLKSTPAPFLSRFSKYVLSASDFLTFFVSKMSESAMPDFTINLQQSVASFTEHLGSDVFIGLDIKNTISALFLSYLAGDSDMSGKSFQIWNSTLPQVQRVIQRYTNDAYEVFLAALCVRLLQLVPPEGLVVKLETINNPWNDMFCEIYFDTIQYFSIHSLAKNLLKEDKQISRKILAYCRTTKSVALLSNSDRYRAKVFGDDALFVNCRDITAFTSQEDFHLFLAEFYKSGHHKILILTIGALEFTDIHLIFYLIESVSLDFYVESGNVLKSIIVLFHFPPEQIFSSLVYPAQFLNGWDTMFVDICEESTAMQIKHFASTLRSKTLGGPPETFASEENCERAQKEAIQYFCLKHKTVPVRPRLLSALSTLVKNFYLFPPCKREKREEDLLCFLRETPSVFDFILSQFAKVMSSTEIRTMLCRLASNVLKRSSSGFAEAVEHHLLFQFRLFASHYFLAVGKNFGLSTMKKFYMRGMDDRYVRMILNLVPKLKNLRETAMQRNNQTPLTNEEMFISKLPLFSHFQRRLEAIARHVRGGDLAIASKRIDMKLGESSSLSPIRIAMAENEQFLLLWLKDFLKRLCVSGHSAYNKHAFRVLLHWTQSEYDKQYGSMVAYCQATAKYFKDDAVMLYSAARSISELGSPLDRLLAETKRDKIMKLVVKSLFKALWEKLLEIATSKDEEAFEESRKLWLSTFQFVYSFFPVGTSLSDYESRECHVKIMSVAYAYMTFQSTSTTVEETKHFLSELKDTDDDEQESYNLGPIIDMLSERYGEIEDQDVLSGIKDVLRELLVWFVQNEKLPDHGDSLDDKQADLLKIFDVINFGICNGKVRLRHSVSQYVLILLEKKIGQKNFMKLVNESTRTLLTGDGKPFYIPAAYGEGERKEAASAYTCALADIVFEMMSSKSKAEELQCGEDLKETKKLAFGRLEENYDIVSGSPPKASATLEAHLTYALKFHNLLKDLSCYVHCHKVGENILEEFEDSTIVEEVFKYILEADKKGFLETRYTAFLYHLIKRSGQTKAALLLSDCSHEKLRSDGQSLEGKKEKEHFQLQSFLSFVTACSEFCSSPELEKLQKSYSDFDRQFVRSEKDVVGHCLSVIRSSDTIGEFRSESCLKMFIVLKVAFLVKDQETGLIETARGVAKKTDCLNWTPVESNFLEFLLEPQPFLNALGENHALQTVFSEWKSLDDDTKFFRDFIVHHVALAIGSGMKSHFSCVVVNPKSLRQTYPFGCTRLPKQTINWLKLDCFNIYDDKGEPCELSNTLSVQGLYLTTALNFATILVSLLLKCVTAEVLLDRNEPILASYTVNVPDTPGNTVLEKAVNFCWERVKSPLLWLQGRLDLSSEQMPLWLNRALERYFVLQAKSGDFDGVYLDVNARNAAEKLFQSQVVSFTTDRFRKHEDTLARALYQNQTLVQDLRKFANNQPLPATFDEFRDSLIEACSDENSTLKPLRSLVGSMRTFEKAKELIISLAELYRFLHDDITQTTTLIDNPLKEEIDTYLESIEQKSAKKADAVREIFKNGVDWFNYYHKLCQGNFQAGACDARSEFHPINDETSLRYVINAKAEHEDSQLNLLYRVLDRLVTQQNDLLVRCEEMFMTDDRQLKVVLEGCSLEEEVSMTEVLRSNGSGIVKVDFSELQFIIKGCSSEIYSEECQAKKIAFDLHRIQRIALKQYVVSGRRIQLESFKKAFQLRSEMELAEDFEEDDGVQDALADIDLSLLEEYEKEIPELLKKKISHNMAESKYEDCLAHCENAAKLLDILSNSLSGRHPPDPQDNLMKFANENSVQLPNFYFVSELLLQHAVSLYKLFVSLTHTGSRSNVGVNLPTVVSQPLTEKQEKSIKDKFLLFDMEDPATVLKESNNALRILHESMQAIVQNPDEKLLSILGKCAAGLSSDMLSNLPDSVMGRHLAAVIAIFASYANSARQKKFEQRSETTWTLTQRGDEQNGATANRLELLREFADKQLASVKLGRESENPMHSFSEWFSSDESGDDDDDDDDLRGGFGPRSVGDEDQLVEDLDEKEFFDNSELGERPDELSTEDGNLLRLEQSREEDEEVIGDAHSDEANGVASEEDETGEDEDDIFDDKKDVADLQNLDGAEEDAEDEDMEEEAPVKSEEGVISGYLSRKEEFFSRSPLIIESEVLLSLLKEHPFAFEPDNSDQIALDFLARVHPVKIEEYVPMGGVKATKDRAKVKLYDLPGQKGPKQSLDTRETLNKKYKGKRFANDAGFVLDDDQLPITKKKTDPCELYYVEEVSSVLVNVNSKETSTVSFFPGDFRASATIENVISAVLRHIGVENAIPAMMSCADGYVIYKDTKLLELDEDKRNNLVCTIGSQLYYHCHFPSGLWDDIDIVPEKLDSFLFSLALEQYSSKTVTLNAADYFVWPRFDDKQLEQAENPVTVQIFPYRGIIAVTVHSPADESDSVLKLPLLVTTCPSTLLEYVRQVLKEDFTHFMVRDTKRILPQHIPVGHTCPNGAELVTIKVDEEWDITAVQSQPPHQVKTIALTGRKTYLDVTKDIEAVAPDIIEEFNEVGLAYGQSRMCFQKRAVFSHDSLGSTPLLIVDGAKTKKRSLPVYIYDSLTYEREKNNEYLLEMAEIDAEIPIPSRLLSQFVSFFDDEADRSLLSPGSHPFGTIEEVNVLFGRSTDVSKLLLSGKPMARIALGCWTVVKPELSKVKISVEKDSREVAQIELELTDQRVLIRDLKMAAAALVGEKSKRCFFTLPLGDEKINEEAAVTCLSPAQESEDDGQPFSFDLKMTVEEGPEEADLFLQFEDHKLEIEVEVDKTYDEVVTEMFEHMGMAELVSNLRAYNITLNGTPCERTEAESGETLKDLLEFVIEEDNPFAEIIVSVEPISKTFHVGIKGASDETFTANLPLTLNKAAVLQEVATSLNVEGKEENSCSLLVNGTELSDDDCLFTIYEFLSDEDLEHLTIEIDVEENEATSEAIDDY